MLGTGKFRSGTKTLYKDANLRSAYHKTASSTPNVDILQQTSNAYQVKVHSSLFNPNIVWVRKGDVVNINMISKPKPTPKGEVTLATGDTMKLFDKNGKELGTFTFKKK